MHSEQNQRKIAGEWIQPVGYKMLLEQSVLLFVAQHQLVPGKGRERMGESLTAVGESVMEGSRGL